MAGALRRMRLVAERIGQRLVFPLAPKRSSRFLIWLSAIRAGRACAASALRLASEWWPASAVISVSGVHSAVAASTRASGGVGGGEP